ncbi:MAG: hypothetical protein E7259_00125 [Lachnospiraceae bacterium]|nr:hypothetical protein [Lachnospiraceae bacterium]
MELKKDEAPKSEESVYSERNSVNDALFGNIDMDIPYQAQPSKSKGSDVVKYAILIVVAFFVIGGILMYNKKIKDRDGTYELVSVSRYGTTYSIDELERISGMDIFSSITVNGSECEIKIDYTIIKMEDVGEIKFRGDKVTISDCSDTMEGTYDSGSQTISIDSDGAKLNFKKVD